MPTIDDPPPHEVLRTLHRPLRVPLTEAERLQKGIQLGEQNAALRTLKDTHKAEKAAMKAAEDELDHLCFELQHDVVSGSETRTVECEEIADYSKGIVEVVRTDTNVVVETRPLYDHERQRTIVPDPASAEDGLPELPGVEATRRRNRKPAEA